MARKPWGSPAQRAALRKAQRASVAAARRRRLSRNHGHAPNPLNRGTGIAGLKKNFTPYVRVNKKSQTIGFNTGTIIKGTDRRVVYGRYVRLESISKKNAVDTVIGKISSKIAPKNTKRNKAKNYFKNNVIIKNPAIRAALGPNAEARLATSRRAGPTIIVRRGKHKISEQASGKSIRRYDTSARKMHAKKKKSKPRPQRRNAR